MSGPNIVPIACTDKDSCGVSPFGRFQHPPVDGCSTGSCNSGALTGGDEHISFYSPVIWGVSWLSNSKYEFGRECV